MNINHKSGVLSEPYLIPANIGKREAATACGKSGRQAPQASAATSGDRVSVSRDAILLAEGMRTAQNSPDIRSDRVSSLRERLANGSYIIDNDRLASSLAQAEPGLFRF